MTSPYAAALDSPAKTPLLDALSPISTLSTFVSSSTGTTVENSVASFSYGDHPLTHYSHHLWPLYKVMCTLVWYSAFSPPGTIAAALLQRGNVITDLRPLTTLFAKYGIGASPASRPDVLTGWKAIPLYRLTPKHSHNDIYCCACGTKSGGDNGHIVYDCPSLPFLEPTLATHQGSIIIDLRSADKTLSSWPYQLTLALHQNWTSRSTPLNLALKYPLRSTLLIRRRVLQRILFNLPRSPDYCSTHLRILLLPHHPASPTGLQETFTLTSLSSPRLVRKPLCVLQSISSPLSYPLPQSIIHFGPQFLIFSLMPQH